MANNILHAVIEIGSKQYLVKEGDIIKTEKIELKKGDTHTIKEVLLITDGEKTQVGQPFVDKASVELKFEKTEKGEKIHIAKFKAKSRYRKTQGHRQFESTFTVTAIKA